MSQPCPYDTYEELAQHVCRDRHYECNIAGVDVGGTFDPTTSILFWVSQNAVRTEAYVRELMHLERQGLKK
jgi:hypothetical protein